MIGRIIFCCLLFSLQASGQESNLIKHLRLVQNYLDSTAKAKVDPVYIEVPDKPWRVILRYKENAVNVNYDQSLSDPVNNQRLEWNMNFQPPMASSVGFWIGYRGTGVSYSVPINKNAGRYFSVSSTGAKYGFNFRLRRFDTSETTYNYKYYNNDELVKEEDLTGHTYAPVWVRSVYLNGYYVFNGRRYSQAAAYNQSVIQRHSAGSFLLGATLYQSSFDFSDSENSIMILYSNNTGRLKLQQANIGIGYGYNLVPFRGFVLNAMAMPAISVYNRVKATKFDCNYTLFGEAKTTDNYGQWNPETHKWANGETHKPLAEGENWENQIESWESGYETDYSALRLSYDLRAGICYNWKDYFIGAQAQLNGFYYKESESLVYIGDGFVQLSLGIRL